MKVFNNVMGMETLQARGSCKGMREEAVMVGFRCISDHTTCHVIQPPM